MESERTIERRKKDRKEKRERERKREREKWTDTTSPHDSQKELRGVKRPLGARLNVRES